MSGWHQFLVFQVKVAIVLINVMMREKSELWLRVMYTGIALGVLVLFSLRNDRNLIVTGFYGIAMGIYLCDYLMIYVEIEWVALLAMGGVFLGVLVLATLAFFIVPKVAAGLKSLRRKPEVKVDYVN